MCSRAFWNDQHKLTEWTEIFQRDILTLDRWIDSTKIQNVLHTKSSSPNLNLGFWRCFFWSLPHFRFSWLIYIPSWRPGCHTACFHHSRSGLNERIKKKKVIGNLTICESDSPTTDSIKSSPISLMWRTARRLVLLLQSTQNGERGGRAGGFLSGDPLIWRAKNKTCGWQEKNLDFYYSSLRKPTAPKKRARINRCN